MISAPKTTPSRHTPTERRRRSSASTRTPAPTRSPPPTSRRRKWPNSRGIFPPTCKSSLTFDTTIPVTEGAKEIVKTLLEAIGLVILVVFIFLQNWRATLIPILTIPVSLVGAFMFFPAVGFTINTLSLLGLVLAVGLVVDDAIVVVEAIEAKIEQGQSPNDAALEAMDEVGGALVGIALVLSAVFIPAGFMVGITGSLYRQFALTIAFSVLLSAFNALTLSPALGALLLRPKSTRAAPRATRALLRLFNAGFARGAKWLRPRPASCSSARLWWRSLYSWGLLSSREASERFCRNHSFRTKIRATSS